MYFAFSKMKCGGPAWADVLGQGSTMCAPHRLDPRRLTISSTVPLCMNTLRLPASLSMKRACAILNVSSCDAAHGRQPHTLRVEIQKAFSIAAGQELSAQSMHARALAADLVGIQACY